MKLHFSWTQIEKALEEVRTASTARPLYEEETGKGLWLVGDEGVYLMPNTSDGIHHRDLKENEHRLVVYAEECDPTKLDFDEWWTNKRASFGGDDGVEFFALAEIERLVSPPPKGKQPKYLVADISPNQISLSIKWGIQKRILNS
jgi:hypothetical protein